MSATPEELALLDLSEDELDLELGRAITAGEFGAKDLSDTEREVTGRRWFFAHLADFRQMICVKSPLRKRIFAADKMARTTLFAAVIDEVNKSTLGVDVPSAVVAARLISYGLDKLCGEASAAPAL